MNETRYSATGRRREAVARVILSPGSGGLRVNNKTLEEYFRRDALCVMVRQPLKLTNTLDKFDVVAKVNGGGISGQAGAMRHGVTRALIKADENMRPVLKKAGFVTRDPRMKERKKYGQKGARKRFQWTKR